MKTIQNKGRFSVFIYFIFCLILSFSIIGNAYARGKKLNEQSVESFIQKTTDLSSNLHTNSDKNIRKTTAYLKKHIDNNARFISTMKYIMPGQPMQESKLALNKTDFINSVTEGQESVADYESHVEILSIKISANGTKATAVTKSMETARMPVSLDGGKTKEYLSIQGTSSCDQLISMSKKGVIQMFGAQCITEIQFLDKP